MDNLTPSLDIADAEKIALDGEIDADVFGDMLPFVSSDVPFSVTSK